MSTLNITQLDFSDSGFSSSLDKLLAWEDSVSQEIESQVAAIVRDVRERGDAAVLEYTKRFDAFEAESVAALELSQQRLEEALSAISDSQRAALETAAERIRNYHLSDTTGSMVPSNSSTKWVRSGSVSGYAQIG